MLLTLHADSLAPMLVPKGKKAPELTLEDLPALARDTLDLHGLNLTTDLLKGATPSLLERFREHADKARCSCLLLVDKDPLPFASEDESEAQAGIQRAARVLRAGQLLGCNSAAISVDAPDDEDSFEFAIDRLKRVADAAERTEMNILIAPTAGLTAEPDRLTEMIKRVGGFRMGTLPDFETASAAEDPAMYLRKLTPYASVVTATLFDLVPPPESEAGPKKDAEPESEDEEKPKQAAALTEEDAERAAHEAATSAKDEPEDAEGVDEDDHDALRALIEDALSDLDEDEGPDAPPTHDRYDLSPMVAALAAVGFDGTIAIRYRGKGDPRIGVDLGRQALEHALLALSS